MPPPRSSISKQLARIGIQGLPVLVVDAGNKACWRFIEFFTANIRNRNTRESYARAAIRFFRWCEIKRLSLADLKPFYIAAYIEHLGTTLSPPTVKQHLAAIRMLFDFLVVGQVVPMNPASSVRGPKHNIKKGKTPVLTAQQARCLIDSIDVTSIGGLRDRALIGVMVFSFARVGAVVAMATEDYFLQAGHRWFRLHEKNSKRHDVPAHPQAIEFVDAYLAAAGIAAAKQTPLFRRLNRAGQLTEDRLDRREVLAMVKRRARAAGLPSSTCCHTFRATGITAYLLNDGLLEHAQKLACHESSATTKLYDRTSDDVSLDEIKKILI
jgi:site-specific recombinase XerD